MVIRDLIYIHLLLFISTLERPLAFFFPKVQTQRIPEPDSITDEKDHVEDYDKADLSSIVIIYLTCLSILKTFFHKKNPSILELACGPGVFSKHLIEQIHPSSYLGIDLSSPMLEKAKARITGHQYEFLKKDILNLSFLEKRKFDLVTFMDAAHHLNDIQSVRHVIVECEKYSEETGSIFICDPVRPRTILFLKLYCSWISKKNMVNKLKYHDIDFRNSLRAAWTSKEMISAIPSDTKKDWYYITPFGIQFSQFLIGMPKNSSPLEIRKLSSPQAKVTDIFQFTWWLTLLSLRWLGTVKKIIG